MRARHRPPQPISHRDFRPCQQHRLWAPWRRTSGTSKVYSSSQSASSTRTSMPCRDARDKRAKLAHYRAISGDSWCTADPAVIRPHQLQPLSTYGRGCCPACALLKRASRWGGRLFVCYLFVCLFVFLFFLSLPLVHWFRSRWGLCRWCYNLSLFSCNLFRFAFVYVNFDSRPHFLKLRHTHIRTRAYARARTHAHTHTHARARARTHSRTHTHTRTHTHAHTHTHARVHSHTHTHTHTQMEKKYTQPSHASVFCLSMSVSFSVCLSVCLSVSLSLPLPLLEDGDGVKQCLTSTNLKPELEQKGDYLFWKVSF